MNRRKALLPSLLVALAGGCTDDPANHRDAAPFPDGPLGIDVLFMPGDARVFPDARRQPDGRTIDATPGPYLHSITIDGTNDFLVASERIGTTTAGYNAYVSWDDDALYIGQDGDDLAGTDPDRWFLVYIDLDPTSTAGAEIGELFSDQSPDFPNGFHADYSWKLRLDGSLARLRKFKDPGTWSDATDDGGATFSRKNRFVELRLPWLGLAAARPASISIVTLFIDENLSTEHAYAGLYSGSFVDGFYPDIPISAYLRADLTSPVSPNSVDNRKP